MKKVTVAALFAPYCAWAARMRRVGLETDMSFRKELAIVALLVGAVLSFAQPSDRVGPVASVSAEQVIR